MHGLDPKATWDQLQPLIQRLRLSNDINNFAEDYSRGMTKKLGLLLALVHRPKLLILDEPTNGLDVESTHLFYDLMEDESTKGTTILFSTHLIDQVSRLCTHGIIINEGEIVTQGALDDLRSTFSSASSLEDIFLQLTARLPEV
jgi:ABC-2 type transport system ATP-binding protein